LVLSRELDHKDHMKSFVGDAVEATRDHEVTGSTDPDTAIAAAASWRDGTAIVAYAGAQVGYRVAVQTFESADEAEMGAILLAMKDARAEKRRGLVFATSSPAAALVQPPGRNAPAATRSRARLIRQSLGQNPSFAVNHVPASATAVARSLVDRSEVARAKEPAEPEITVNAAWHDHLAAIAYSGQLIGRRVAIRACETIGRAEMDAVLLAMKDARAAGLTDAVFATDSAPAALVELPKRSAPGPIRDGAAAIRFRLEQNPGWRLVHASRRATGVHELVAHQRRALDSPAAVDVPDLDVAVDASWHGTRAAIAYAGGLLGERLAFCVCNDINEAEIRAVLLAMEAARAAGHARLVLGTDNEVAALIHAPTRRSSISLQTAAESVRKHLGDNPGWQLIHVTKSMTTEAHRLATQGRRDAEATQACD
jgi:ribonuclease HI